MQGLTEPGLVLTPPAKGTSDAAALERDDGFLTASEIAGLKLMPIGWSSRRATPRGGATNGRAAVGHGARVLLCGGPGATGLALGGGLRRRGEANHTRFAELKSNPRVGRAEALRLSMRALIERGTALEAHPSQWAPFVVVGEGPAK